MKLNGVSVRLIMENTERLTRLTLINQLNVTDATNVRDY